MHEASEAEIPSLHRSRRGKTSGPAGHMVARHMSCSR